jgi:hypothetical protein
MGKSKDGLFLAGFIFTKVSLTDEAYRDQKQGWNNGYRWTSEINEKDE